jgi:hypothetical protein
LGTRERQTRDANANRCRRLRPQIAQLHGSRPSLATGAKCVESIGATDHVPRLGIQNLVAELALQLGQVAAFLFWQMLRGESDVTITVHRMAERLDAGDVVATQSFAIGKRDSLDRVIKGTKYEGARLFIKVLRDLRMEQVQSSPLDMKQASYFSFPRAQDVREFRKRGHRLL